MSCPNSVSINLAYLLTSETYNQSDHNYSHTSANYIRYYQFHPDDEDSEIEFSESVLTPSAESYYEECSIQYPGFCPYQNSSDDETMDFDYSTKHSTKKKKSFKHVLFYIGIDGTDSADMIREHIGLDDAVPLLTAIDFPKQRMVTMKYGDEITTDSVQNFVDAFLSGNADFKTLKPYSEKC